MLTWHKAAGRWVGIYGRFRAEIYRGEPPLRMWRWSVRAGDKRGGSGATSSVVSSKRQAERETERFAKFLMQTS